MSEKEKIELFERINTGIRKAQRQMVERKAALGLKIIIADADGYPVEISAKDALGIYKKS